MLFIAICAGFVATGIINWVVALQMKQEIAVFIGSTFGMLLIEFEIYRQKFDKRYII